METNLEARTLYWQEVVGNLRLPAVYFLMALLPQQRTTDYKANLAGYAFLVFAVSLILLYAGGFTTTIGAGMVFLDWPLSNGSLNPPGWTTEEAMLAEHSHRLLGMAVGSLSIGLVAWMYMREARQWLRRLSYLVLALVVIQGLLGGLRVLLVSVDLAQVHGVMAQLFLCSVVAVAVGASRWWRRVPARIGASEVAGWQFQRRLGFAICGLLIAQLVIGAVMRHQGAGLAIPHFPMSTAEGGLFPMSWNFATTIHFTHRMMAMVIAVVIIPWAVTVIRSSGSSRAMKVLGGLALLLLVSQIALGAGIIWSVRRPIETTLHVLNGALLLSVCWATTFAYCRSLLPEESALATSNPIVRANNSTQTAAASSLAKQAKELS